MAKSDPLLLTVQDILFRQWDPIGVNRNQQCRNEYDSYAPTICRWLRDGVDEYRLAQHLNQLQRVNMGMSVINDELHRRVARLLLELLSWPGGDVLRESRVVEGGSGIALFRDLRAGANGRPIAESVKGSHC